MRYDIVDTDLSFKVSHMFYNLKVYSFLIDKFATKSTIKFVVRFNLK